MDLKKVLDEKGFFKFFTEEQAAMFLKIGNSTEFHSGDIIIPEMTRSRDIYILGDGAVSISMMIPLEGKRSEIIDTVHPGDILGEIAFIDGSPRSATVKAEGEVVAYVFKYEELEELMRNEPALGYALMRTIATTISSKMRQANLAWRNLMMW